MNGKWSDELRRCTIEHFGDLGATGLKNINGSFAIGYDRNLFITDKAEKAIPDGEKNKRYILTDHDGRFISSYDSLEDLARYGLME